MGLYDAMNASVTGMGAQSNYLTNIGQNIANAGTTGYKQADTEFSTMVDSAAVGSTAAGGVTTNTRLDIASQGTLQGTSSSTDLAVSGNGFFVVSNSPSGTGQEYLTRAGSFVPDKSGNLVNAAGYYLMGYSLANGAPTIISNSLSGMQVVNVSSSSLSATPTTTGTFAANLPSTDMPTTNNTTVASASNYTEKTSMVMYDDLGGSQTIDLYFQPNGQVAGSAGPPVVPATDTWSVAAYTSTGTLIVTTPPASAANMSFDATSGKLLSGGSLQIPVTGGKTMTLDLSGMTQLDSAFAVSASTVNGNPASSVSSMTVGADGTLSYELASGATVNAYQIPLASVASPDNLEESTVDIATELTNMIVAQRDYEANSQMFKAGADLMNTLIQMNLT
jgi:flagellar hook protein FlgE